LIVVVDKSEYCVVVRDGDIEIPGGSNKGYNLGEIKGGGIKKSLRYIEESNDQVCMFQS
jgi:hypothetical protein